MTHRKTQTKKVKIIGIEEYINSRTGELEQFHVLSIEDRDANFSKLWLGHILEAVDEIGNAKMRILVYLLEARDHKTNLVVKTYKEIAEATDTSLRTVVTTIRKLLDHDIVRRKPGTRGVLFINPGVIFRGGMGNRLKILLEYKKLDEPVREAGTDNEGTSASEKKRRTGS